MAPRLSGQNCKSFKSLCPSVIKRDFDTKEKGPPKQDVCHEY